MILFVTASDDEHANHVASLLDRRGAEYVRFNPAQFPREAEISLSTTSRGDCQALLRLNGRELDFMSLRSIWYRRPERPVASEECGDELLQEYVEQECAQVLQDLWRVPDCLWLPGRPNQVTQNQFKFSQLKIAGELGFELPPTLVTTSEADLIDFYNAHNGQIVSKLAGFAYQNSVGSSFCRYTELVTKRDIAYSRAIRFVPMIFQAYVPKRVELRITVVGQRVFPCEIHSQSSNHTRHDWRRYDEYKTPHFAHELPADIERRCVQLVERLDLAYGAIDMVLTPDGQYVFLEINPTGQYLWIEEETGLPISEAICDLLIQGLPDRDHAAIPTLTLTGTAR